MNLVSRLFFRTFQFCFRMALPILPYREPEIYHSIFDIGNILKDLQITPVLLVTDEGLIAFGGGSSMDCAKAVECERTGTILLQNSRLEVTYED